MSRRMAFLVLAGLFAAQSAEAFQFGACTHLALGRSRAEDVSTLIDSAGFNSMRDDMFWGAIESEPDVLRIPEKYRPLRSALTDVASRGGRSPIVILAYGNRHYDGGGMVRSDAGIEAYARYAGFVAKELRPDVRQFEVWNEWNSGFGSKPRVKSGSAEEYARLLASAARAIHKANPDAQVIGGVTAGVDLAWFREFVAVGGLAHLDAVSVHSYTLFRREVNPEGAIASLDKLRTLLRTAEPTRDIPVYVTEMGWPTNRGKHGVSERGAAMYLARFMLLARTRPWIRGVWWYDLIDDGNSDAHAEQRFGLVRRNLAPKPAFHAARAVAPLVLASDAPRAYRFRDGGYLITGSDARGRWAVGWAMHDAFLDWKDGATTESAAPAEFAPLSNELPADGYPVLFRFTDGAWRADPAWLDEQGASPASPENFRLREREAA